MGLVSKSKATNNFVEKLKKDNELTIHNAIQNNVDLPPEYNELAKLPNFRSPPPPQQPKLNFEQQVRKVITDCYNRNQLHNVCRDTLEQTIQRALTIPLEKVLEIVHFENEELAYDFYQLALYDAVIMADNSTSMTWKNKDGVQERIQDLEYVSSRLSRLITLFDDDGVTLVTINGDTQYNNLNDEKDIDRVIKNMVFSGATYLGKELNDKIIQPYFVSRIRELTKPILVIVLTDGEASDEKVVESVLANVANLSRKHNLGNACVFQFAQLGDDENARKFLERIDKNGESEASSQSSKRFGFGSKNKKVENVGYGHIVDCTSGIDSESKEVWNHQGIVLTPEMWMLKISIGAIDAAVDGLDE